MNVKEQFIPLRMLAARALLDHMPHGITARAPIEDEFARLQSGWRGEQNLAYHLETVTDPDTRIFYNLRQTALNHIFQMDTLLLNDTFALIMEVKNYSGTLLFESSCRQMIRTIGNRREGFSNPLIQVSRHRDMLTAWLADHWLSPIPIEPLVVITNTSTIIDSPGNLREVIGKVIHAEQSISKIDQIKARYQHSPSIGRTVPQIEQFLLQEHTDPPLDLLKKYNVDPADLQHGVRCPNCYLFAMGRAYANWICRRYG
ncbi:nuclease-related domain-containing protein [Sporolactobacillus pectinivorans]|uniref:nuclease-related domain-containing protein n=1 Tax=Sporolactobacillus pectinivorans TaxID=1591408 RepID=UPI000C265615|nr:nuclease-related domain-containing protein [Sporolactobacillus pectinivorans]